VVDLAGQGGEQRMGADRVIAPLLAGQYRGQFHEAGALARTAVLAAGQQWQSRRQMDLVGGHRTPPGPDRLGWSTYQTRTTTAPGELKPSGHARAPARSAACAAAPAAPPRTTGTAPDRPDRRSRRSASRGRCRTGSGARPAPDSAGPTAAGTRAPRPHRRRPRAA